MSDTRVVVLNGARQVGKITLAQQVAQQRGGVISSWTCDELANQLTGSRPGEKQFEELQAGSEDTVAPQVPCARVARPDSQFMVARSLLDWLLALQLDGQCLEFSDVNVRARLARAPKRIAVVPSDASSQSLGTSA
jgi:FlaA1/EpsC-like NDP-sugar epimerase